METPPTPSKTTALPDWRELVRLPEAELAGYDVAVVNLACAAGLPGADRIDPARTLKVLDDWAVGVRQVTEDAIASEFRRSPAAYDHSEPLYRMAKLVLTLQTRCGVRYNPAKVNARASDPCELDDQFIHRAVHGPGGTCASLPVVFAAVGRRLGYPVRLVKTRGHMLCRWDDPATGERVNIEGARMEGVNTHTDDYYRTTWHHPLRPGDEEAGGFLLSLGPRRELAEFLTSRGAVAQSLGDFPTALEAFTAAVPLDAPYWNHTGFVYQLVRKWTASVQVRNTRGVRVRLSDRASLIRQRLAWPWTLEYQIRWLEAMEQVLRSSPGGGK